MRIECVPAARLVESDWSAWEAIRGHAPGLASPYFSSTFCRIVSECSPDLFVARIRDSQGLAGFFPFHRSRWGTGWPLARGLSGYQGVIGREGFAPDVIALLKECKLKTFDFSHLPASQVAFSPFSRGMDVSHTIDLRRGFDEYAARIGRSSRILRATWRRKRRMEREVGPVRLELHVEDSSAFQMLLRLKAQQYRRTGVRDLFADPWTTSILHAIRRTREPHLSGVLSVLYAGDQVAALLFGMRSLKVLHYWFPAYDPRFAPHSPGITLLVELARRASESGVDVIDLGTGTHAYKRRLATGAVNVHWGRIERPSLAAAWRIARRGAGRLTGCLRS